MYFRRKNFCNMIKIIITLFLLGLSFGSGPCLASCGPMFLTYMVGTSKGIRKGLLSYIFFSLGRIITYIILALCVFWLGKFLLIRAVGNVARYLLIPGGIFIILAGAMIIIGKNRESKICRFLNKHFIEQDRKSVFVMGCVIGLLPCAPLAALFSYVGLISKTWLQSILYSISFGLGTALSPIILFVILTGLIPGFFKNKKETVSRVLRIASGVIIVFLGIQLIWRAF